MEVEGTSSLSPLRLRERVLASSTMHIFGAGLNPERPAHTAVSELAARGWACAPVHPRDAGATIDGFPIRPSLDGGLSPEIVVLFLAPERARNVIRDLIIRLDHDNFPLIWFQRGAEDPPSIDALEAMGAAYVAHDCIVEYTNRNDFSCSHSVLPQTFCLQTASEDGDGCSVWTMHSSHDADLSPPTYALEWIGSIEELERSNHTIPRYIRSLQTEDESLISLAARLTQPQNDGKTPVNTEP
jgi:predicted CoA-binding protein